MRHKKVEKRVHEQDKIYQSVLVSQFINRIMKDGKKTVAEKSFYNALEEVKKIEANVLSVFETAIKSWMPYLSMVFLVISGSALIVSIGILRSPFWALKST